MVTRARLRSRSRERGAAVFVVVMAVTLLGAVGLFAAHSATLVDQAAGYNRLARQTQQIAEYGTIATAADFGSGAASTYLSSAQSDPKNCIANKDRTTPSPCFRRTYKDISDQTQAASKESLLSDQSGDVPDVIGVSSGAGDGITGSFFTEITDIGDAGLSVPGVNKGDPKAPSYRRVTATTVAQLRPAGAVDCAADTNGAASSLTGQQAMRAHLIVGPM